MLDIFDIFKTDDSDTINFAVIINILIDKNIVTQDELENYKEVVTKEVRKKNQELYENALKEAKAKGFIK